MDRRYFKHAKTHLTLRARHMILDGLVDYFSVTIFRPMCLTHDAVFDLEAVDRDWFQTRTMHVGFDPSRDIIEIHGPEKPELAGRAVPKAIAAPPVFCNR
jgi:hypothetical protein